jgi:leader peptidase (prepilin peptidase) / N-methyltransferase
MTTLEQFQALPFHFWSVVFFVLGCVVGSFLNVCIHRLPLGLSIVSPPSHCPHCKNAIPWYLNVPLLTWLMLRGRCRWCAAPIAPRYFFVELLTGVGFLACWLAFGHASPWMALTYCLLFSGLEVSAFIDAEHTIIPDELTLGGIGAGILCSFFVPALHGQRSAGAGLQRAFLGAAVGAALVYAILRLGKLLFGRAKLDLPPDTRVVFTETAVILPDQQLPYEDFFYRDSDALLLRARTVELVDRGYTDVLVRLTPKKLRVGEDEFDPATVPHLEAVTSQLLLPREAMGLGDVKFMAAIGAFLGWPATVFSLFASALLGLVGAGIPLLLRRGQGSRQLPYGPYIAAAAVIWMFAGDQVLEWLTRR